MLEGCAHLLHRRSREHTADSGTLHILARRDLTCEESKPFRSGEAVREEVVEAGIEAVRRQAQPNLHHHLGRVRFKHHFGIARGDVTQFWHTLGGRQDQRLKQSGRVRFGEDQGLTARGISRSAKVQHPKACCHASGLIGNADIEGTDVRGNGGVLFQDVSKEALRHFNRLPAHPTRSATTAARS